MILIASGIVPLQKEDAPPLINEFHMYRDFDVVTS